MTKIPFDLVGFKGFCHGLWKLLKERFPCFVCGVCACMCVHVCVEVAGGPADEFLCPTIAFLGLPLLRHLEETQKC